MKKFEKICGIAAPLPMMNIDTDMIIPKQFLKTIKRSGLGKNLFHELRYDLKGNIRNDFVLNWEPFNNAIILITGENFGCGSSREHAPWSLLDFGFRCVIAPSFADIFFNNCFKNGILPIKLKQEEVDYLIEKHRDIAEYYTRRFIDYMSFNQNLFPEYTSNTNDDIHPDKDALFNGWVL